MSAEPTIRNLPSEEGAALGAHLAGITEHELARLRKQFPNHQAPCGTCAFRRGTFPNRCAPTVMDALKCVLECKEFLCHESGKLCHGWMISLGAVADLPPMKVPWDFSLSPEQILEVDGGKLPGGKREARAASNLHGSHLRYFRDGIQKR